MAEQEYILLAELYKLRNMAKKGLLPSDLHEYLKHQLKRIESLKERLYPYVWKASRYVPPPSRVARRYGQLRVITHVDRSYLANTREITLDITSSRDRLLQSYYNNFFQKLRDLLNSYRNALRNKAVQLARGHVAKKRFGPNYKYYYDRYRSYKLEVDAFLAQRTEEIHRVAQRYVERRLHSKGRLSALLELRSILNNLSSPDPHRIISLLHQLYIKGPKRGKLAKVIRWAYKTLLKLSIEPTPLIELLAKRAQKRGFSVKVQGSQLILRPEPRKVYVEHGVNFPRNYILSLHLMMLGAGLTAIKIYVKELWRHRVLSPKEIVKRATSKYNQRYRDKTIEVEWVDPFHNRHDIVQEERIPATSDIWVRFETFIGKKELSKHPNLYALRLALLRLLAALLLNELLLIDERAVSRLPIGALLFAFLKTKYSAKIENTLYLATKIWYKYPLEDFKDPPRMLTTEIVLILNDTFS